MHVQHLAQTGREVPEPAARLRRDALRRTRHDVQAEVRVDHPWVPTDDGAQGRALCAPYVLADVVLDAAEDLVEVGSDVEPVVVLRLLLREAGSLQRSERLK